MRRKAHSHPFAAGEALFRDPAHYFSKISRSIEADAKIAKEIGESVFYTDDDLYSAVCRLANEKFSKLGSAGQGAGRGAWQGIAGQAGGVGGQTAGMAVGHAAGARCNPSQLPAQAKLELARAMRFEYNASDKQIQRMLKLDPQIISSLFTKKTLQ